MYNNSRRNNPIGRNKTERWGCGVMESRYSVNEKITLSVTEVAEILGVSRPVVYQLIHRDDFPSFKIGSRTVVPRLALEEWANAQVAKK